jgi:hypothetical protein
MMMSPRVTWTCLKVRRLGVLKDVVEETSEAQSSEVTKHQSDVAC